MVPLARAERPEYEVRPPGFSDRLAERHGLPCTLNTMHTSLILRNVCTQSGDSGYEAFAPFAYTYYGRGWRRSLDVCAFLDGV